MSSSSFKSPAYNLLPDNIVGNIPALRETVEQEDPIFHLKWFTPDGGFTWYVCEYDPVTGIAFGFVVGPCPEWGTFSIHEIRSVRGVLGLPVERDLYFKPCPSSAITKDYY